MIQYYSVLKENTLFKNIQKDQINDILMCLGAYEKKYSKNEIIRYAETEVTEIGLIVKGLVYVTKMNLDGSRVILGEFAEGKSFGESLIFAGAKNSPVVIIAAEETEAVFIPAKKIFDMCNSSCKNHLQIIKNTLRLLAEKNMLLQIKVDILSQKTIKEKLLLYFEYESRTAKSKKFKIRFSREELADFLCINTSALSRELGKMRDEGIVEFHKNKIILKNENCEVDTLVAE